MMLKILGITIVFVAIAFAAMGVKMLLKKGGKMERYCASVDPKSGTKVKCTCSQEEWEECERERMEKAS